MKRRTPEQDSAVPRELVRFVYADWADGERDDWPMCELRARQSWWDAQMQWSADNGMCIYKAMGEEHTSCNLCWIAEGRMKPPGKRRDGR